MIHLCPRQFTHLFPRRRIIPMSSAFAPGQSQAVHGGGATRRRCVVNSAVYKTLLAVFVCLESSFPCGGATSPTLNVVLITIDTLRPDHLGCYGYASIDTPTIDRLARGGIRFTHAY